MTQDSAILDQLGRINEQPRVSSLSSGPKSAHPASSGWKREPAPFYDFDTAIANWAERWYGTVYGA